MAVFICEAEYIVVSEAVYEGIWMKDFIIDFGVVLSASGLMIFFCDNTGVFVIVKEFRFYRKSKYIKRRYNFIQDYVQSGVIDICNVYMDLNIADPLIKFFLREKYD